MLEIALAMSTKTTFFVHDPRFNGVVKTFTIPGIVPILPDQIFRFSRIDDSNYYKLSRPPDLVVIPDEETGPGEDGIFSAIQNVCVEPLNQ